MTRSYALTQKIFDVSTMLGYVGQGCWTHETTGKANLFRPRARAGLYICPAEDASAQLFFDLKSMRLQLVQSVSFASTPDLVLGLLADSGLYAPHGAFTAPAEDAHAAALRALLTWSDDLSDVGVTTDPLTGT